MAAVSRERRNTLTPTLSLKGYRIHTSVFVVFSKFRSANSQPETSVSIQIGMIDAFEQFRHPRVGGGPGL